MDVGVCWDVDNGDKWPLPEFSRDEQGWQAIESRHGTVKSKLSTLSPARRYPLSHVEKIRAGVMIAGMESHAELVRRFMPWFMQPFIHSQLAAPSGAVTRPRYQVSDLA
jgi:hypothetical protein